MSRNRVGARVNEVTASQSGKKQLRSRAQACAPKLYDSLCLSQLLAPSRHFSCLIYRRQCKARFLAFVTFAQLANHNIGYLGYTR
jgi:hypothetical protein